MFVSSYSTYIQPNKTQKEQPIHAKEDSSSRFSLLETPKELNAAVQTQLPKLPVDYVSTFKSLYNQARLLDEKLQQKTNAPILSRLKLEYAQDSYTQNATAFVLYSKPKLTLSQTPLQNLREPEQLLAAKERVLRAKMVETYEQNERYFKRSA